MRWTTLALAWVLAGAALYLWQIVTLLAEHA
jgi:hypothetical protein